MAKRNGQSKGMKYLIIGLLLIFLTITIITLCIVLPIVLTKAKSSKEPTLEDKRFKFLTKCQEEKSSDKNVRTAEINQQKKKLKLLPAPERVGNSVLIKNTYIVEFPLGSNAKNHFRTVARSLKSAESIHVAAVKERYTIDTPMFSGISFTVNTNHSVEALETISNAVAIYPVYMINPIESIKSPRSADAIKANVDNLIHSYNFTGVAQVHDKFQNYGKGVRVAIIDSGIYYLHPALGGCFGPGCKVAFGYDYIGDEYKHPDDTPKPDNDPLDNCTAGSHGTHVAGIIAANTTGINDTNYIPLVPFTGVAPQVTLGAYRVFGCTTGAPSDAIINAIYRAYTDGADIINLSLGDGSPYPNTVSIAIQQVVEKGVYVVIAQGNSGSGGLQTGGSPANSFDGMAVGSIDNTHTLDLRIIFAPDGSKIYYQSATEFGGWRSSMNLTIVINDLNATVDDGCNDINNNVSNAVVLFRATNQDWCTPVYQCSNAEKHGAVGCLFYMDKKSTIEGSENIPIGVINLKDALKISQFLTVNHSAVFTFTDMIELVSLETTETPSDFSSFGLSADLFFKPQISGIGGYIYSTISPEAAKYDHSKEMYNIQSGTSMASPYVAGTLALFLASIGNPAPNTTTGRSMNNICRPKFSLVTSIFQSTAKPVNLHQTSLLATTAIQGAGSVNVHKALTCTTIISPSQLSLNDTVRKFSSYKVNVTNIGKDTARYTVSHQGAALATGQDRDYDQLLKTPVYSADYATVTIEPNHFELKSEETQEITLQFQTPYDAKGDLLPIYSGFIYVTNQINKEVVHLSYAGVVGDYSNATKIVRNPKLELHAGVITPMDGFIINERLDTLNASNGISIISVLSWATRLYFVEAVISTNDTNLSTPPLRDNIIVHFNNTEIFLVINAPRNTIIGTQTFSTYDTFIWDGYICNSVSNNTCTDQHKIRVSPGQYRIRFSALKNFGNLTNPNDYDIYLTPPFNLVY